MHRKRCLCEPMRRVDHRVEPAELENDVNSLQAEWELPEPQFVYLACQAVALLNMDPMLKTLEVSHEPMA